MNEHAWALFDQLICAGEKSRRYFEVNRLRSDDKGMWRASKQAQANVIAAIPADHEEFPRIMG
jgi:hypothetical protein